MSLLEVNGLQIAFGGLCAPRESKFMHRFFMGSLNERSNTCRASSCPTLTMSRGSV